MRLCRLSLMQAGAQHHGDPRLHVKLYATREFDDSDRLDGDAEQ